MLDDALRYGALPFHADKLLFRLDNPGEPDENRGFQFARPIVVPAFAAF